MKSKLEKISPTLLLETIKIEDRQIRNADYHNRRLNKAREDLFGISSRMDILNIIKIPIGIGMGMFKCRIIYDRQIRKVEILPHQVRPVKSLKIVEDNEIDYGYKFADRRQLETLLSLKGDCDDVLIVKNGCITDTSYSNIIFYSPEGSWITPDTPLLRGTMRQFLLETGQISEKRIRAEDLFHYDRGRMINCLMGLETGFEIAMSSIIA